MGFPLGELILAKNIFSNSYCYANEVWYNPWRILWTNIGS